MAEPKASGPAYSAKMALTNKISQLLLRPLTKQDILYTTTKSGELGKESYQSNLVINCLDETIEMEGPTVTTTPPEATQEAKDSEISPEEAEQKAKDADWTDSRRLEKAKKAAEAAVAQLVLDKYAEMLGAGRGALKRKETESNGDDAIKPPAKKAKTVGKDVTSGMLVPVDADGVAAGTCGGTGTLMAANVVGAKSAFNQAMARILKRCVTKAEMAITTNQVEGGFQCRLQLPAGLPAHYQCIPTTGDICAEAGLASEDVCMKAVKAIAVIQRILAMKGAKKYAVPNK